MDVTCAAIPDADWGTPAAGDCAAKCDTMLGDAAVGGVGAVVTIDSGYDKASDSLVCTLCNNPGPCTGSKCLGIGQEWAPEQGVLFLKGGPHSAHCRGPLKGSAKASVFAAAVASVEFHTTSPNGNERSVTWNYGHASFSAATGRYYRFFSADHCDAAQAQCSSAKMQIFGLQGYLMTITSQSEEDAARAIVTGSGRR
eukprot:gene20736-49307_t